jgi:XTP/dITP diphosphohydrolase
MNKIVLASGNKGKLREFSQVLKQFDVELIPQSEFAFEEVEETGLSFVENAILKARHACTETGLPALADDSGIEVDALNGQPGIYSARFAGVGASDEQNNEKLLTLLKDVPSEKRTARFQCVLVYMRHAKDPTPQVFQGSWEGRVVDQADGNNGFGYDPLFFVPTEDCCAAALTPEVKNTLSHRGQALKQFIQRFTF